jgi:hypothetical protein
MSDYARAKVAHDLTAEMTIGRPIGTKRNMDFIWPSALVIGGVVGTFVWVTFLAWCVWNLFAHVS